MEAVLDLVAWEELVLSKLELVKSDKWEVQEHLEVV
jgi:hypothetical protein